MKITVQTYFISIEAILESAISHLRMIMILGEKGKSFSYQQGQKINEAYWIFVIPQIAQKLSQKSSNDQKF